MKKICALLLVVVLVLTGCGASNTSPLKGLVVDGVRAEMVPGEIVLMNEMGVTITEVYSAASTNPDFGENLLGGATFDSGTSLTWYIADMTATQDLLFVDSSGNSYAVLDVPVEDAIVVTVGLTTDDGTTPYPIAIVFDSEGNESARINGIHQYSDSADSTGFTTQGNYIFTVNNRSSYDIYSIMIGIAGASSSHDIDVLPAVLKADTSVDVTGVASMGDWSNTEWTIYITDVDGDTSASYDTFNPWLLSAVDISWDNDAGGYVAQFFY